jgi:hypothetical protein
MAKQGDNAIDLAQLPTTRAADADKLRKKADDIQNLDVMIVLSADAPSADTGLPAAAPASLPSTQPAATLSDPTPDTKAIGK